VGDARNDDAKSADLLTAGDGAAADAAHGHADLADDEDDAAAATAVGVLGRAGAGTEAVSEELRALARP
jgi:hypothetical protein